MYHELYLQHRKRGPSLTDRPRLALVPEPGQAQETVPSCVHLAMSPFLDLGLLNQAFSPCGHTGFKASIAKLFDGTIFTVHC